MHENAPHAQPPIIDKMPLWEDLPAGDYSSSPPDAWNPDAAPLPEKTAKLNKAKAFIGKVLGKFSFKVEFDETETFSEPFSSTVPLSEGYYKDVQVPPAPGHPDYNPTAWWTYTSTAPFPGSPIVNKQPTEKPWYVPQPAYAPGYSTKSWPNAFDPKPFPGSPLPAGQVDKQPLKPQLDYDKFYDTPASNPKSWPNAFDPKPFPGSPQPAENAHNNQPAISGIAASEKINIMPLPELPKTFQEPLPDPFQSAMAESIKKANASKKAFKDRLKDAYADRAEYASDAPVAELLANRNFVRRAPSFEAQLADAERTNTMSYIANTRFAFGTSTEGNPDTVTVTEQAAINDLASFLENAANTNTYHGDYAASIRENITYIGQKEYLEATAGIAEYWRSQLLADPDKQICVITNRITRGMVKSDAYLLDNIMKNFSDEDIEAFGDRFVLEPEDITASPENVDVVLLDDWTISGSQMSEVSAGIAKKYPQLANRMHVQLIAANQVRIEDGLDTAMSGFNTNDGLVLPVKAYFMAHGADPSIATYSGSHITGSHCAVDYDFNNAIAGIANQTETDMPAATNIVRPYRQPGIELLQTERLRRRDVQLKSTKLQPAFTPSQTESFGSAESYDWI